MDLLLRKCINYIKVDWAVNNYEDSLYIEKRLIWGVFWGFFGGFFFFSNSFFEWPNASFQDWEQRILGSPFKLWDDILGTPHGEGTVVTTKEESAVSEVCCVSGKTFELWVENIDKNKTSAKTLRVFPAKIIRTSTVASVVCSCQRHTGEQRQIRSLIF